METKLVPGQILGGKYRVERLIQQGGMGTVYQARHEELDQSVAIKVLDSEFAGNPEAVARFVREARAAAKLESKHVVRVSDVGTFEGVGPYLVMELLTGIDLRDLLEKHGPFPVALAVDFILEAIDALAEAHSLGIIHRDIKPSNLFLADRADGSKFIKVLDFGVSKVRSPDAPDDRELTQDRMIVGSPSYMSPEQFRDPKTVDARTDIWSLGVVLYKLLTGMLPFEGESFHHLALAVLEGEARPLAEGADVPPALESAVMKCLEKNPENRFATAADMGTALAPFGSGRASKTVERAFLVLRRRSLSQERAPARVQAPPSPVAAQGRTAIMLSPFASGPSSPHVAAVADTLPARPGPQGTMPAPGGATGSLSHVAAVQRTLPLPISARSKPSSRRKSRLKVFVVLAVAFLLPLAIGAVALMVMGRR